MDDYFYGLLISFLKITELTSVHHLKLKLIYVMYITYIYLVVLRDKKRKRAIKTVQTIASVFIHCSINHFYLNHFTTS